jgi:hypothetical protein
MANICIQIQTHTPHFHYTNVLVKSLLEKTNVLELNIPIFIVFDNIDMQNDYINKYHYNIGVSYLNLIDIMRSLNLNINEKPEDRFKETINTNWGIGGHRNHVAVKRTYSILELEKRGFTHVWCMDCESLVLRETNLLPIIDANVLKPLLLVGKDCDGEKLPQIVIGVLQQDFSQDFQKYNFRMNDFWFIHTSYFSDMIKMIFKLHNKPISYFMKGSEQSVYENYLLYRYFLDENDVEIVEINCNLHNNLAFNQVINNTDINIDTYAEKMNTTYFNKTMSFRGDYIKSCMESERGSELINKLNIQIAVSNYQGF